MGAATRLPAAGGIALALASGLAGCGKIKQNDPAQTARVAAEAKRDKAACASATAYDRLKNALFDEAIGRRGGDRANLDTLADYSTARMEEPLVKGRDAALDLTRCTGRFILEVPPGAERGLAGERRLQADIDYTAQAAADGSGFVYQLKGGEPIVARLAAFNLAGVAYRPPPAVDEWQGGAGAPKPTELASAEPQAPAPAAEPPRAPPAARQSPAPPPARQRPAAPPRESGAPQPAEPAPASSAAGTGGATVRAFYAALGAGNGGAASAHVVPEKRSSRAFSPDAITHFYGRLPGPLRVTAIAPVGPGAYRVGYRYSTGRSHCTGTAIVTLASRGGQSLIRSIRALSGC